MEVTARSVTKKYAKKHAKRTVKERRQVEDRAAEGA